MVQILHFGCIFLASGVAQCSFYPSQSIWETQGGSQCAAELWGICLKAQSPWFWSWAGAESLLSLHGKLSLKLVLKHDLTSVLPSHRKKKKSIFLAKKKKGRWVLCSFLSQGLRSLTLDQVDFNDCFTVKISSSCWPSLASLSCLEGFYFVEESSWFGEGSCRNS